METKTSHRTEAEAYINFENQKLRNKPFSFQAITALLNGFHGTWFYCKFYDSITKLELQ